VECVLLNPPDRRLRLQLTELEPETLAPRGTITARIDGDTVRFRPTNADVGAGTLSGEGIEPVTVVWGLGVCTDPIALQVRPHFDLAILLEGDIDAPHVFLEMTCERHPEVRKMGGREPDADGLILLRDVAVRPDCELATVRHHGSLTLRSDPQPVPPTDAPQELVLPVPSLPATGLGGYLDRGAIRVDAIALGSRGEQAGLKLRDRLYPAGDDVDDVPSWLDTPHPLPVIVERDGVQHEAIL
jgi:hypothetical protein